MNNILSWNVRGLNGLHKQKEVYRFLLYSKVGLGCLLETKVKNINFPKVYHNVCNGWNCTTNFTCSKGGRILVIWLQNTYTVEVCQCTSQFIHAKVTHKGLRKSFYCTFVYASNSAGERAELWQHLKCIGDQMQNCWLLLGDFNTLLHEDERIGSSVSFSEIRDFKDCVVHCDLSDMKAKGCKFTWNNKQQGESRVYSKLDRTLINPHWVTVFPDAHTHFLPKGTFDHCPALIKLDSTLQSGKKPFRFYNMWVHHPEFLHIVEQEWQAKVDGVSMYRVVQKLRKVKGALKHLNGTAYSEVEKKWQAAKVHLKICQENLHEDVNNRQLVEEEKEAVNKFLQCKKDYISFLSQKAKST